MTHSYYKDNNTRTDEVKGNYGFSDCDDVGRDGEKCEGEEFFRYLLSACS